MNDGMSNYTLDFESDSEDEIKEKQTKQTEECLNNYRGVFNNYREVGCQVHATSKFELLSITGYGNKYLIQIKLELKEVAQTVEIEGLGNYVTDRKKLRLSKSNQDVG